MKPLIFKVLVFASTLTPFSIFAQTTEQNQHRPDRIYRPTDPKKHRMPSSVFIEYMLTTDGIQFFPSDVYNEGEVTVVSDNSDIVISGNISEENGYFLPGNISNGEYTVTCVTEDGTLFSGVTFIEN